MATLAAQTRDNIRSALSDLDGRLNSEVGSAESREGARSEYGSSKDALWSGDGTRQARVPDGLRDAARGNRNGGARDEGLGGGYGGGDDEDDGSRRTVGDGVVTLAPRPSPEATFEVLERHQSALQNAFPFGGGITDYAYYRVRPQLEQLMNALVGSVIHYLPPNEQSSSVSLDVLDGITEVIHQLPDWENHERRYHKENAYDEITLAWAYMIRQTRKRGDGSLLRHGGEWDQKIRKHNQQSGGRMQVAENALGNNLR